MKLGTSNHGVLKVNLYWTCSLTMHFKGFPSFIVISHRIIKFDAIIPYVRAFLYVFEAINMYPFL